MKKDKNVSMLDNVSQDRFLWLLGIILIPLITFITFMSINIQPAEVDSIIINNIILSDESLIISGDTSSSSLNYRSFNYYKDREDVFIAVNFNQPILTNPDGVFDIEVIDNLKDVKNIYLYDINLKDNKLIYSR